MLRIEVFFSRRCLNSRMFPRKLSIYLLIFTPLVLVIYLAVFKTGLKPEQPKAHYWSCHFKEYNNALPKLGNQRFLKNSIFFVESSCTGGLSSRQACAVEAAATTNRDSLVVVFFTSTVTLDRINNSGLSVLQKIGNVMLFKINLEHFAASSPVFSRLKTGFFYRDDINMNIGTILKFLTIYKYPGIYLDLDVIVARSFKELRGNWIVKENPELMSSSVFSFIDDEDGRLLASLVLHILKDYLIFPEKQYSFVINGSDIFDQLMNIKTQMTDLTVHEPEQFYPLSFEEKHKYFKRGNLDAWKKEEIYTFHTWDRYTKYTRMKNDSLYAKIGQKYCPKIYKYYGDKFGKW
ncbi:alpha-1,4-N-acetylglucosaminyltransferase-like isoform X2 [Anticarsia gemmatalis]|uniref:alpha-1,4-N-acetylglucosaminyltransferase-like isoform X2 n=1 Tax=Anticarsia gemmatalis TaxID=129554 RepID=UPI003F765E92